MWRWYCKSDMLKCHRLLLVTCSPLLSLRVLAALCDSYGERESEEEMPLNLGQTFEGMDVKVERRA